MPELVRLYRLLEAEMEGLRGMWREADGLPEPIKEAFQAAIDDEETRLYLGLADGVSFGFILAHPQDLLPQADGERVVTVKLVFTEEEARGVGIGEAMRDRVMADYREIGFRLFDAHVLPGHRLAKNFFEAGGFSARFIIMHHADE
jgi:GNAT superfamily N-acetyltransferase